MDLLERRFLSIVDKGGDGTTLLVRARRKGGLEAVFRPRWWRRRRTTIPVPRAHQPRGGGLGHQRGHPEHHLHGNSKEPGNYWDSRRHNAYMDVWSAMYASAAGIQEGQVADRGLFARPA